MTLRSEKAFLARFWTLFDENDERAKHLIGWSKDGKYFYILDTSPNREDFTRLAIERGVLQRSGHGKGSANRKTSEYDNIARQLRYYGFNRCLRMDIGRQIAWSHSELNRDSSVEAVRGRHSNAPSKSKKYKVGRGGEKEVEGKEYYNPGGSLDRCTTTQLLLDNTNMKPISVKSGIAERAETSMKPIIYGASMVTFDKPLKLYDLENVEEWNAIEKYELSIGEGATLVDGGQGNTQTLSPILAPQSDWMIFDLGK